MGYQLLIVPGEELSADGLRSLNSQAGNDVTRLVRVEQLLAGVEINKLGMLRRNHACDTYLLITGI